MELLTVIKCLAAQGRSGARPNPSIIGARSLCVSCTPDICTLYALLCTTTVPRVCTLVLFINIFLVLLNNVWLREVVVYKDSEYTVMIAVMH